jgi:hypothetical protein
MLGLEFLIFVSNLSVRRKGNLREQAPAGNRCTYPDPNDGAVKQEYSADHASGQA